jgi:hypothetical protein
LLLKNDSVLTTVLIAIQDPIREAIFTKRTIDKKYATKTYKIIKEAYYL